MPAPVWVVGNRWVYRCSDGYRDPVVWQETHEVTAIDATGIAVRVTGQGGVNFQRMELLVSPGVVKSGAVYNPDETRNFEAPMVRFEFPLNSGARWSQRLHNLNGANQLVSTISREVSVGGYESVTVPAGTFNAMTMRTIMTVDDNNPFQFPTQADYMTWWSAAAGNVVRKTKTATYRQRDGMGGMQIRAQNTTIEMVSFRTG